MYKKRLLFSCFVLCLWIYREYLRLYWPERLAFKHLNRLPDFENKQRNPLDLEVDDASKREMLEKLKKNLEIKTKTFPVNESKSLWTTKLQPHKTSAPKKIQNEIKLQEADFIGDEYTTDHVPHQTSCSSGIPNLVRNTDIAGMFLFTVPVLQWAKHYSTAEYQRLKQYPGAHGWGSVGENDLQNSLAILNTSANQMMFEDWDRRKNGSECIRCAVVGNGGILNGSGRGLEIDQHHYVFRTNGVILKGFEKDVGSRTSHYIISINTLSNSIRNYKSAGFTGAPHGEETRYVILPDHDRDYNVMRAEAMQSPNEIHKNYFGSDVTVEKFKIFHPDFIRYLRNRFLHSNILKSRYKSIYRPSTGAVMLLAALHTCDQVSAYGFITPDFIKYSDHYYDRTRRDLHFYANHDMKLEMRLWQQLHKAGLMQLYMRT